jgi:hypothetical protein
MKAKKPCDICKKISRTRRVKKIGGRLELCPPCAFQFYINRNPKPGYIMYDFLRRPSVVLPSGTVALTKQYSCDKVNK